MKNQNLPDPVFRKEQYLNRIATGVGDIPDYPIFREEIYLDYICKHPAGGDVESVNGKTGAVVLSASDIDADNAQTIQDNLERIDERIDDITDDSQLAAINSGIDSAKVGRMILTPISTPTEPTLLGVDTANSESQFKLGHGLETDESTSPFTVDVKGFEVVTTAPTAAHTGGFLKIAFLDAEPATKYDGWLYLIKEA